MPVFASVALIRRNGATVYKPPRKERSATETQARKSAARFWCGHIADPDVLLKVVLVSAAGPLIQIAERAAAGGRDQPWVSYQLHASEAVKQPQVAACLSELGIDPDAAPPLLPDTLEINGVIYRREI